MTQSNTTSGSDTHAHGAQVEVYFVFISAPQTSPQSPHTSARERQCSYVYTRGTAVSVGALGGRGGLLCRAPASRCGVQAGRVALIKGSSGSDG